MPTMKKIQSLIIPLAASGSQKLANASTANRFESGCLRTMLGEDVFPDKRVCNSDDPDDGHDRGICIKPDFDYQEVRISNQDWDGPLTSSWIIQILLSELLQVPTTIETNSSELHGNFYDSDGRSDASSETYPYHSLRMSKDVKDCRRVRIGVDSASNYVSCAHVMPMVNSVGQSDNINMLRDEGVIDQSISAGNHDQYRWWIPKRLATEDPTLVSFYGIGGVDGQNGEEVRFKLANTFKRPMTWSEYCILVSPNNCTRDDGVASRAPMNEEVGKYFMDGLYTGHFRSTEKNNCTANPTACTGHIADVNCVWGTYAVPQAYHLGIPVSSDGDLLYNGGYGYSSLLEIYSAANATRSNILMYWWEPDTLIELYRGTDYEFVPVHLPSPTKECVESRPSTEERCAEDFMIPVGDPEASCDAGPVSSDMLIALDPCDQNEFARCSPAHAALQSYKIKNIDLQQIYQYRNDHPEQDRREAVCKWFADNIDTIKDTFIPRTYPRQRLNKVFYQPFVYAALVIASLSLLCVLLCAMGSKYYEKEKVMVYAQVDFLLIVLSGLFLVAAGSVLSSVKPSKAVCVARQWLVAVGYSLELIPLMVKVSAINHLLRQGGRMKRVEVKKQQLYFLVGAGNLAVLIYLIIWTVIDPPVPLTEMALDDSSGDYIVEVSQYCSSSSPGWQVAITIYLIILLVITAAIATQNRGIRAEFNEALYLAVLSYSHFMFIILRSIIYFVRANVSATSVAAASITSLLLSADTLIALAIYFLPKLIAARKSSKARNSNQTRYPGMSHQTATQYGQDQATSVGDPRTDVDTSELNNRENTIKSVEQKTTKKIFLFKLNTMSINRRSSLESIESDELQT